MQVNSTPQTTDPVVAPQTANAGASSGNSNSNSLSGQLLSQQSFMQILTAQLQDQDPFQPIDPTTMVTQLVQFDSLNELISIQQELGTSSSASATNSGTASNTGSTTAGTQSS